MTRPHGSDKWPEAAGPLRVNRLLAAIAAVVWMLVLTR